MVVVLMGVLLFGCFLMAEKYPWAPMLITSFGPPWSIGAVRHCLRPYQMATWDQEQFLQESSRDRMRLLVHFIHEEAERISYYRGAELALICTFALTLGSWIYWLYTLWVDRDYIEKMHDRDDRTAFVLWISPLVVALTQLVFAGLINMRVSLANTYVKTNQVRSILIVETAAHALRRESLFNMSKAVEERVEQAVMSELRTELAGLGYERVDRTALLTNGFDKKYAEAVYNRSIVELIRKLKYVVGGIVTVQAGVFFVSQLTSESKGILPGILWMVQAWLMLIFIHAVAFLDSSFHRLFTGIRAYVRKSDLSKAAVSSGLDWARAALVYFVGPLLPAIMFVSAVNQCVRKCRGIRSRHPSHGDKKTLRDVTHMAKLLARGKKEKVAPPPGMKEDAQEEGAGEGEDDSSSEDEDQAQKDRATEEEERAQEGRLCVTLRMHRFMRGTREWNWPSVVTKVYVIGMCMISSPVAPLLLNIFLSWMSEQLKHLTLPVLAAAIYSVGVVMFLLPPVPGAPVYLFGGILISGKGMKDGWPGEPGDMEGFWFGTCVSLLCCWLMKLSSTLMLQKCVGQMLGSRTFVRSAVGVHKPVIRAIEMVLRRRGCSVGKVLILCGGPDWPTSVLAGVLRMTAVQCMLGTAPVFFYVAPFCLTGSFYVVKEKGVFWENLSNLMLTTTAVMTIGMWALIVLVIQVTMTRESEELKRDKEEYVELEWMDHRASEISKHCEIGWYDIPCCIRHPLSLGCLGMVVVGNTFYWFSEACLGTFEVTTPISDLSWYGEGEGHIIKENGLIGLCSGAGCLSCWILFSMWRSCKLARPRKAAIRLLDAKAADWKRDRIEGIRRAEERAEESAARSWRSGASAGAGRRPRAASRAEDRSEVEMTDRSPADSRAQSGQPSDEGQPAEGDSTRVGQRQSLLEGDGAATSSAA